MPLISQGLDPVFVLSEAIGYKDQIDHPMIVQSESYFRLIGPTVGPASEN